MPTSAAATAMMKSAKTMPFTSLPLFSENAMRLMFTPFRISSIDISTSTAFLRASTP